MHQELFSFSLHVYRYLQVHMFLFVLVGGWMRVSQFLKLLKMLGEIIINLNAEHDNVATVI